MTNCGSAGWVTDRTGYRYSPDDPQSGKPWPAMPPLLRELADRAATSGGFAGFAPDVCLINRYVPGAKMSLHQDKDELDFGAPIVSVSLGLPAIFMFGGIKRSDKPRRFRLEHGDVAVWGGPSRLFYHGVAPLAEGNHPVMGPQRLNLTFRKIR
jgi:alkylated DNA repair protein (DNA oxidative demethylase)